MTAPAPANDAPAVIGNAEAEAMLLGGLMLANQTIDQVADRLLPEDFSEPLMGRIYSAIVREHALRRPVTPVTLRPYFTDDPAMLEMGGPGFLAQLTGSGASVVGIRGFADQVLELARRRRMVASLQAVIDSAGDYNIPANQLAADAETAIADASREQAGLKELSGSDCVGRALAAIERQDPGVTCGITAVDGSQGPIRKGNLAIVAGRPGMGKTALAVSYSNGATRKGHGVLFVSLEMTDEELGERLACDLAFDEKVQLPYAAVTEGRLNNEGLRAMARAQLQLRDMPLEVIDASGVTIHRLAAMVRRWKRRFAARGQSLDLVIVDYLQRLAAGRGQNRYEAITEISQGLKEIAKANDVGVMALAQLSRKVEERPDKRPMLSDLRESGQIEQDADVVTFLLREEYYLQHAEPAQHDAVKHDAWRAEMDLVAHQIDFICAKRRKGRPGASKGRFYGAYQAVRDAG